MINFISLGSKTGSDGKYQLIRALQNENTMASEQDVTSDSLDASVVAVPKELIGYVKTSIVDYINKATPEEFSANVHYAEGQAPKLDVLIGGKLFLVLHN